MAINDDAVVTAAVGYLFFAEPGTAAITPDELEALPDVELYGCKVVNVKVTGTPTSYTLLVKGNATSELPLASTPAVVQAAIEAIEGVGAGNVLVDGVNAGDTDGLTITFLGSLQGQDVAVAEGTYVGGTTPDTAITTVTAVNGWTNYGHTSRDDMPEFGFDGGDTEVKGSWQKKALREVLSGDPIADSVTIKLEQWDNNTLELYFGEKDESSPDGVFGVSGDFNPIEKALQMIIVDGSVKLGFYAAKASIKRDDSVELPVDDFSTLPVKATFLKMTGRRLYDWINKKLFPAS